MSDSGDRLPTRDYQRELAGRQTSINLPMSLTPQERQQVRDLVDRLAEDTGQVVTSKGAILAAIRASQALLGGQPVDDALKELRLNLGAAKPGPKGSPGGKGSR